MLDTLKKITMSCRKVFIRSFYKSGSSRLETCRDDNFLLNNTVKGFTLIELLVVVLIIGILASVALPQYQVAVEKSKLARFIPMVRALVQAEEAYYLEHGAYTDDLEALDIEIPHEGCTYQSNQYGNWYYCNGNAIGIYNDATNVQAQTKGNKTAYLHFLADYTGSIGVPFAKGDRVCFSKGGNIYRQACRALGPGEEKEHGAGWDYIYILK